MSLTEGYDAVETLSAYGEQESFRICVQIWTLGWKAEGLDACISQEPTYLLGEQRVPVVDEVSLAKEEPIPHISEVPRHLLHPIPVWIGGDTTNAYATSSDIDDKHEPAALIGREPESFAAKLGSEKTVLLLEVLDHGLLIAVDPASQAEQ